MSKSANPQLVALMIGDPVRAHRTIVSALRKHKGNVSHAARELSVTRRTLTRWLEEYEGLRKARTEARKVRES